MKYQIEEISKQIQREKTIKKTIKILVLIVLGVLLIMNLAMLYQTKLNPDEIPHFGGISVFNIVSESMTGTINVNDVIVIKKCNENEIKKGDIITYKKEDKTIVTHRVTKINKDQGYNLYTTKGDHNTVEDEEKIRHEQVQGKYLFKISGMGNFVEELQKNNGLISVMLLLLIFIIIKNGNDKKKENRKKIREKYDIKKKRDEHNKRKI